MTVKVSTTKACRVSAHAHGPLVTLQSAECLGAELGLLTPVTQSDAQALADTVCRLVDVDPVPVELVWAPNRRPRNYAGWHCGGIQFPLFPCGNLIVLNCATRGNNLRTLAHELAHHVVEARRLSEARARPSRLVRSHGRPFPATFREMVCYVYTRWRRAGVPATTRPPLFSNSGTRS